MHIVDCICLCWQHERDGSSAAGRDLCDGVDRRSWTMAHFTAHNGMAQLASKVPKPSFDALTPPQGSSSIVNVYGPGGMTPLMVASMSPAADAAHGGVMDAQAIARCAQYNSSAIIPDLIAEGASTEDRTDFSGAFYYFLSDIQRLVFCSFMFIILLMIVPLIWLRHPLNLTSI